jgi:ribosomal protein L31E
MASKKLKLYFFQFRLLFTNYTVKSITVDELLNVKVWNQSLESNEHKILEIYIELSQIFWTDTMEIDDDIS